MLSFEAIQKKYGDVVAYSILMDIERHLKLCSSTLADVDPSERFNRAIAMMENCPVKPCCGECEV